jgi:hypothetical protein
VLADGAVVGRIFKAVRGHGGLRAVNTRRTVDMSDSY